MIDHALKILNWQENLTSDEMPPQWMWAHDDELNFHFDEVERRRKDRFGGGSSSMAEEAPMMENALARGRR